MKKQEVVKVLKNGGLIGKQVLITGAITVTMTMMEVGLRTLVTKGASGVKALELDELLKIKKKSELKAIDEKLNEEEEEA